MHILISDANQLGKKFIYKQMANKMLSHYSRVVLCFKLHAYLVCCTDDKRASDSNSRNFLFNNQKCDFIIMLMFCLVQHNSSTHLSACTYS